MQFSKVLEQCQENFSAAPRHLSWWQRLTYLRVPRPNWLYQDPDDKLETLFLNLGQLFRNGRVVWGHIVQANMHMFKPGTFDCPGELVYSLDAGDPITADELTRIAKSLQSLKGTQPNNPEFASIADYLTDEMIRVHGKPVPKAISSRYACFISTTYFVRKHLPKPGQFLRAPLLPIIVSPTEPHVALTLPSKFWPKSYLDWWNR
jgi:hypothetical protein